MGSMIAASVILAVTFAYVVYDMTHHEKRAK